MAEALTIGETIDSLREALKAYIEATYHVSHPVLIRQRSRLLDQAGVIAQKPFLESTPRYQTGDGLQSLRISDGAKSLFQEMANPPTGGSPLIIDPPYRHQAQAVEAVIEQQKSLVLTTGTGSGKTEAFLLPILAKLAAEADQSPGSFAQPAVRALILYPMNALVNDQLGRLRLLLGDPVVSGMFKDWAGRPARFARYTSRTPYPGVRTVKKDRERLRAIGDFYAGLSDQVDDPVDPHQEDAGRLIENLKDRGKWPAKPDMRKWYGESGQHWRDKAGEFQRAVMLDDDVELMTRHEVLENPPDLLVTNYSMLEYMLMRPLERPIFDMTRDWLAANPDQRFLLVVDEAHLYRGAAGTEVGLLLRRLRDRLDITAERLQVICTSASFHNPDYAPQFAASLSGKEPSDFVTLTGDLALRDREGPGDGDDASMLAAVPMEAYFNGETDSDRLAAIKAFLDARGVESNQPTGAALYEALREFPPMNKLVNLTMQEACALEELGGEIFPGVDSRLANQALTTLVGLGSAARPAPDQPGLLPCRVHSFYRGLPGIWACLDQDCSERDSDLEPGPVGAIYGQPQDTCLCGSRVFELFTCRNCGVAYARAYTDNVESPSFLWAEPGEGFWSAGGVTDELEPLDLLLEPPQQDSVQPADLDLVTGRLDPESLGDRVRRVFLKKDRVSAPSGDDDDAPSSEQRLGEFRPCGVCAQQASFGRSSVQDHQTKGDQPFQALVARQLSVQPPNNTSDPEFAPLRGRKVLIFSDSRQTAARLAPNLQNYSTRDALRPLVLSGWTDLKDVLGDQLTLEDLYFSVLVGASNLKVRLRPKTDQNEPFDILTIVRERLQSGALNDPAARLELIREVDRSESPESLIRDIHITLTDNWYGLPHLALGSVREKASLTSMIDELPDLPVANTNDQKRALVRMWLHKWSSGCGIWLAQMPASFKDAKVRDGGVRSHKGDFAAFKRWMSDQESKRNFKKYWLDSLLGQFCGPAPNNKYWMLGKNLTLDVEGGWGCCSSCRSAQRIFPGSDKCSLCCSPDSVVEIDPDTDEAFVARKGHYRAASLRALNDGEAPIALIAAEHTAQLNAAQADDVFSRAEEYELLFQDVDPTRPGQRRDQPATAIDVLSSTTTMEVGIDIGALSGVALRNMPPARSNYQQRAGRAGRRGNAVATVLGFGTVDSHDEHYFREPEAMVRGVVEDPRLTLDNEEIARRHLTAFLLQRYHQDKLPVIKPDDQPQLFEVLGTVRAFLGSDSPLNRGDFEEWLRSNEDDLRESADRWIPGEIDSRARNTLLAGIVEKTLESIDGALPSEDDGASEDDGDLEVQAEVGEEGRTGDRSSRLLLDRLLYQGVLPRYAYPTDVAQFHVFDVDSAPYRPKFQYAPSQGLPIALSQYAPGKEVWIDGKLWRSAALYSPMPSDRFDAWAQRRLYFECNVCRYACTETYKTAERGEVRDCPACGSEGTFGTAKNWMRPPGFAHRHTEKSGRSPDDQPSKSYATRAKLQAAGPDPEKWQEVTTSLRQHYERRHLLMTNSGPRGEGYTYCTKCGVISPTAIPSTSISAGHPKPYPDEKDPDCEGSAATRGLVLGTDFITDVLLLGLEVEAPLRLQPGHLATNVALRTVADALTIASCRALEVEVGELQAEYRPALSPGGMEGREAEIYMYDTLPGGAGFARRVGEMGQHVFEAALQLLEGCPAECDRSCYRCLRSYKNRFEHELLDRHVGATLLRYLLTGRDPTFSKTRLEASTDRLFCDLERHGLTGVEFSRNAMVEVPGLGPVEAPILATHGGGELIVGVHSPLTPDYAADEILREAAEYATAIPVHLVDEILITRNLPNASSQVLAAVGQ